MRTLTTCILCALSTAAHANFWSGNQIVSACSNDRSFVVGYVTGWADKHEPDAEASKENVLFALKGDDAKLTDSAIKAAATIKMGICLPAEVTSGQMTDVFCKSLSEHPERRHFTAASLLEAAFAEAFPCK